MRFRLVRCDWVRYGSAGKVGWVDFGFGAVR